MNKKIKRLLITLCLGFGLILFLLQIVAYLPAQAQEMPCADSANPGCVIEENKEGTAVSPPSWLQQRIDRAEPTPEEALQAAYQRVADAGAYEFTAESQQTLLPRPLPEMIGQTDQRLDMHIDGEVTLPDSTLLSLSVYGLGLDSTPISILQEGANSYYLQEGEKIPFENPLGITSPGGDYLSYLAAAENVAPCETDDAPFETAVSCYTYDINGQRYAEHVRDQLQTQLASGSQAPPPGVNFELSPSPILMSMSGAGKVWLDVNGLPLRQAVDMRLPEMNEYYDVDARLVVDYHFATDAITAVKAVQSHYSFFSLPIPSLETAINQVEKSLPNIAILIIVFAIVALLIILRHRRWMYGFIAVSISGLLILTPLLEILSYSLYDQRAAHAAESTITFNEVVEETLAEANIDTTANTAPEATAVTTSPYAPDVYCGLGDNSDRDGDGLADDAEYCLGTDANNDDSDHDGISDGDEVAGFTFNEKTWFSDPLNPDSNLDGVKDGDEWTEDYDGSAASWDLDSDNLPNLWDNDDDGDGVGDKRDLSPASFTNYFFEPQYGTQPITNTFNFNITGSYNGYIYVEMQVQPKNLEHLRYGITPLDWGYDNRGQIQDLNSSQDDIQLISMLSVESNIAPSSDLRDQYNVTVMQDTDSDGYQEMLIPLSLVGDAGMSEAFGLRMAYGPETLADLGQAGIRWRNAKIVWIVQGKLDSENSNNEITEKKQPIHMYTETAMRFAGWQVTKSGHFNSAILGTPDMPKDDRQLFQLLFGMSGSYLNYNEITLSEIAARFSGANTPIEEKWGVTTTVKIDSPINPYSHYDEGVNDLDDRVKSFLTDNYSMNDPAVVIIASESTMGLYGQDDAGTLNPSVNQLGVNLNEVYLVETRSLELHMRDGWKAVGGDDFDAKVLQRNVQFFKTAQTDLKDQYPTITENQLVSLTLAFYMIWQNGRTRLMSVDGIVGENTAVYSDLALYQRYSLAPLNKFGDPSNTSTLAGYLVETGNFAQPGAGLIFESPAQIYRYLQSNAVEAIEMGFNAAASVFINAVEESLDKLESAFDQTVDWLYEGGKWLVQTEQLNAGKTILLSSVTYVDTAYDTGKLVGKAALKGKSVVSKLTKTANKLSKVSKVGIALLILDIGMQVTMFIIKGDFSSAAIAGLIAGIILSVMLFIIALNPVGAIIVAIVGVVDLILMLVGLGDYQVSGYVTKFIALGFYSSAALTRLKDKSIAFVDRQSGPIDENMGYVVGNRYEVSDQFKAVIELARSDWSDDFSFTRLKQEVAHWGGISGKYLGKSWACAEFTVSGWATLSGMKTTCPSPQMSYDPDNPPSKESVGYQNPLYLQVLLDKSGANLPLIINTKITVKTYNLNGGIVHLFKSGSIMSYDPFTLKLPDNMKKEERAKWKPQTIYLDVLPATIDEFWAWGTTYNGRILTNYDPDGDGMTNKDEINVRLGSKAYAILKDDLGPAASSFGFTNIDQLLMAWETDNGNGTIESQLAGANLCPTGTDWPNLCDTNTTAFWLTNDSDGDGLSDKFEYDNAAAIGANYAKYDTDGDGLSDGFEYNIGTSINAKDTDGDGLTDDIEVYHPTQDGSWTGGYVIQLPKYGAVGPNGRFMIDVRVLPDPRSKDADGDGLSDTAEKESGISPTAFNRASRINLNGTPWAVSPTGQGAVYIASGDAFTLTTDLQVFPPFTVSEKLTLRLPGNLMGNATTTKLNGSRSVPNTGVTLRPEWNFATEVLQPWEHLYGRTNAWSISSLSYSRVGTATLTLPFNKGSATQTAEVPIVVDADNPSFGILKPAHGELIGGDVSHYVMGGSSSDYTTWVDHINLYVPGSGTETLTDTLNLSPWAYTWELPSDGIYTINGRSYDFVDNYSAEDSIKVMVDNTAPTVDVDLVDGSVYGPPQDSSVITITLNGTASENYSGLTRVQISTDDGPWREVWTQETATVTNTTYTDFGSPFYQRATGATWDAEWTLPNVESVQGYHSLRVRAFDAAGNWPTYIERTIIIDVLPPTDDLVNRAYLNAYPHVPANEAHTFSGVANDVGNVPEPSRPVELVGDLDSIEDATIWLGTADINENNAGVNVAWIGDFNGDRRGDLLVGLPAAADGAGQVAVVYGRSGDWPIPNEQEMLADSRTSFIGLAGAGIGLQAKAAGDVNGDGLADLLIGDAVNNRVYLILGNPKYLGSGLRLDGSQGVNIRALQVPDGQQIGHNLGAAGDVNGDGYDDLLIGVTGSLNAAYLLLGQPSPIWETDDISQHAAAKIMDAGTAVLTTLSDLDGDFRDEFAVGANSNLYLFAGKGSFAPRAGSYLYLTSSPVASFASADALPNAAALGDVNGDNLGDFIYSDGGSQHLVFGDATLNDGSWSTFTYNLGTGFLAAPGDVDNDGRNDILIGDGTDVHLILGSDTGTVQSTIGGVVNAASVPYAAGADLNSDGSSDLLLVPTAASAQAAATTSDSSFDLPPTWVPRLTEQTLDTFVGATTWPSVPSADAYVNGDGVCYGLTPCYTTIQTAVNARSAGDLIIVQPGAYGSFVVNGKNNMTIQGTNTDAVFVDANGGSYTAQISNATGVQLKNMTLRNASYGVQLDDAGINGHEVMSNRTILDHLLIYNTGAYNVYLSRSSAVSVTNSTLAQSSNHFGAYGPADPNISVQWNAMDNTPWSVTDGGGAVAVGNTVYVESGGGGSAFGRYDAVSEQWMPDPWGPNNPYEPNSAIAAGSDGQVYLVGAPGWNTMSSAPGQIESLTINPFNDHVLAAPQLDDGLYEWDGSSWTKHGGAPYHNYYDVVIDPTNGDIYMASRNGVEKWDGSSWTTIQTDGAIALAMDSQGTLYAGWGKVESWDGSSWSTVLDNFDSGTIWELNTDDNDNLFIGGDFTSPSDYIAQWDGSSLVYMGSTFTNTVKSIAVDETTGDVYACGDFAYPGVARWDGSSWDLLPKITENHIESNYYCYDVVFNGQLYASGSWGDYTANDPIFARFDGTSWEILGDGAGPGEDVWTLADSKQGIYLGGAFSTAGSADDPFSASNAAQYHFSHEVYTTTANSWSYLTPPPIDLGDGASYAGDDNGNLVLLAGGDRTDSYKYSIADGTWTKVGDIPDPVNASAMTLGENGYVYAVTDGGSSLYYFTGSSWSTAGPQIATAVITDGVALAYDSQLENYYVLPGGNSINMLRYNSSMSDWETLPVDRNTLAGVRPGAALAFVEGEDGNKLYTPQGNYIAGPSPSSAFWMYPLPQPNKVGLENTAIYAQTASSWLNLSDPLPEDFNFRIGAGTLFFGGSGWTPTNKGTLPTTTATPFLDPSRNLYRMGESGYTVGYHTYTAPVTATTTAGIQAAINTGANRVVVESGIYEEDVYLMNGVELIGANPDWTIIRPLSYSGVNALIRSAGATGTSISRFTLDGQNSGLDGLAVTGNAEYVTLQRTLIYDTDTAVAVDGVDSDLEVAHVTAAQNVNGFAATNCASVDVRNSIFAYHAGSGLSHEGCAAVNLHTYNLYWANASDFGGTADAGAAELFLDPNFVDAMDHDYRTYNYSPIIDAGNPTDPAPPGAGSRADIGYVEQGRVNFYVDDSYCDICINDGLTWQVDAFDTIQDALDAANNALLNLNPSHVDVPQLVVGIAPGTYVEQVTLPSHVLLMGSGAEETTLDGSGGTAVTANGVTNSGIRDLTLTNAGTAVLVTGSSNSIDLRHNIFTNNTVGLMANGRGTADLEYNTFANNTTGILADGSGSWAMMMDNIVAGSGIGASAVNNGQIFTDFNLFFNTVDFNGVDQGDDDLVGQDPLFAGGGTPYRLSETSPAIDAALPLVAAPNGGGLRADLGYSELLAAPITLLLGQEDLSTAMGNSGVASVEYGVVTVADPTTAVTETLPAAWTPITLETPGATYSYWSADYTPLAEGLQRFYSRATDMVGNQEDDQLDWYDGSFVVDSSPPVVTWLAPPNSSSLQSPLELRAQVSDYAAGAFSVEEKDVYFEINGQRYQASWAAEPWDEEAAEPRIFRAWVDPAVGSYSNITAVAEDKAGNVTSNDSLSFTITGAAAADNTDPNLTIAQPLDGSWVTRTVEFAGTATDIGSGIASVEVSVDGGSTWRPATVSGSDWSLIWEGPEDQSFVSYPVQVRTADHAGNITVQSLQFTIDEVAPTSLLPATFNFNEESHFDTVVNLEINWQPPVDASGVVTTLLTVDQISDTIPVDVAVGTTAVANLNATGEWYVHLTAVDAAGNASPHHFGPWHLGLNEGLPFGQRQQSILIDGYVDVDAGEWKLDTEFLDDDERTVGSKVTYSPGDQQTFLTTWDSDNTFMAWRGAQWTLDGDLWIYINSGAGGSDQLIQPLTSAPGATLPFDADYAVQITDPLTGTLWEYGSGWQVSAQDWAFAQGSSGDTEIRLPLFGTSNVETLAFGLGDDGHVWAIFPATNPLNPGADVQAPQMISAAAGLDSAMTVPSGLNRPTAVTNSGWQSYHWDDITTVTDVAANQPQAAGLELSMTSNPTPMVMPGPNSVMEYVVRLTNQEDYTMTGKQIAFIGIPFDGVMHESIAGATCATTNPWLCTLDPLPPGASSITLTMRLASDLSGIERVSMFAMLQDSSIPPELNMQSDIHHVVDSLPPEVALVSPPYATLGSQTFIGTADDGNGIGVDYVEVRPAGGSWQRVEGTTFWTADLTVPPFSNHGDVWEFEVRSVDLYGQVSAALPVSFTVDLQAPAISLDVPDGFKQTLNDVIGIVTDSPSGSETDQVWIQIDNESWREASIYALNEAGEQTFLWVWNTPVEDGASHTLDVRAIDLMGNESRLTQPQSVWVDNVSPVLTVTNVLTQVVVQDYRPGVGLGAPVMSGQANDGGGLAQVQVFVELPSGQSYRETAVLNGNDWEYTPVLELVGDYRLRAEVQDTLGNEIVGEYFDLNVIAAPDTDPNTFFTQEDTPISFEPLLNDLDLDGDTLSVETVGDPAHGTAIISPTTWIVYTPTLNFNGTEVFTYTASDGSLTDTAIVTVTVTPVNDAPVIGGSAIVNRSMSEDGDSMALSFNSVDVDGDTLTWHVNAGVGTAVISDTYGSGNANIDMAYTPVADFTGLDSFTIDCSDGQLTDTVTVRVTVLPVDDAPRSDNDFVTLILDDNERPQTLDVLTNDVEVDGQSLSLSSLGIPSLTGTAVISGNLVVYTPTLSVGDTETITYAVSDGGLTDTAVITAIMVAGDARGEPDEIITINDAGISDTMDITITIPANVSDEDFFTVVFKETAVSANPPHEYKFAGLAFTLDAYVNGVLTSPYTLTAPITLTVEYADEDVAHILRGEQDLDLWYWDGSAWGDNGITLLERDMVNNRLVFSISHFTEFALFGWDGYRVHLPLVINSSP